MSSSIITSHVGHFISNAQQRLERVTALQIVVALAACLIAWLLLEQLAFSRKR